MQVSLLELIVLSTMHVIIFSVAHATTRDRSGSGREVPMERLEMLERRVLQIAQLVTVDQDDAAGPAPPGPVNEEVGGGEE